MLKIIDNVDLKELEKFGFIILISNDKDLEYGSKEFWDNLCYKKVGNHFYIVIENDQYIRQLTIVPENGFPTNVSVTWQLDTIYDLVNAGLVEKVSD